MSAYLESQQRARRAQEAQARQWRRMQLEQARAQRAAERAQAQRSREALQSYQQGREADVAARNRLIEDDLATLRSVLSTAVNAGPFRIYQCKTAFDPPRFNPGPLGMPVVEPKPSDYQVPALTGIMARTPKARAEHEAALARARAAYEADWHRASQLESDRLQKLAAYHSEFQQWVSREQARVEEHNRAMDDVAARYGYGDDDGVLQFFSVVASNDRWPESFPIQRRAAWDAARGELVVAWQLPGMQVVPESSRFRYVKSTDQEKSIDRPAAERRVLYRDLLAQCALRTAYRFFSADYAQRLKSLVFTGFIRAVDPVTGREAEFPLVSVAIQRDALAAVDLRHADPVSCVEEFGGRLAAKPDQLQVIVPHRLPESVRGGQLRDGEGDDIDLLEMDPLEFEKLVATLFKCRGYDVMTTSRSGDSGVDVFAVDRDPLTGGKIAIQVKRYRKTVNPAVVRELYGTVIAHGAAKGILVTTSGFGPDSRSFADELPLKLIDGPELVQLLREQGLPGHIGSVQTC
ncbi:restriction endonuclease [Actinospica sp. MGRD01-02]|uniref:Restriction endonuclease n=1 Tax=Actinospica acidithermotolerans TaxID=2828514 RepID=A0A941ECI3_9ACTN|nr:restriction endonuclease [Actinospica acidithermotolerans]MBR7827943.1 restriction endonuclease [Actinospica acidithermotolerans]